MIGIYTGTMWGMDAANDSWRYNVTPFLIGWVHTNNVPAQYVFTLCEGLNKWTVLVEVYDIMSNIFIVFLCLVINLLAVVFTNKCPALWMAASSILLLVILTDGLLARLNSPGWQHRGSVTVVTAMNDPLNLEENDKRGGRFRAFLKNN